MKRTWTDEDCNSLVRVLKYYKWATWWTVTIVTASFVIQILRVIGVL